MNTQDEFEQQLYKQLNGDTQTSIWTFDLR